MNPFEILHIMLDVGTNNSTLLSDPLYRGLKHKRLRDKEYDLYLEGFVRIIHKLAPTVVLHWEDFVSKTAHSNLKLA